MEMTLWNGNEAERWPHDGEQGQRQAEITCPYAKFRHSVLYTRDRQHGES